MDNDILFIKNGVRFRLSRAKDLKIWIRKVIRKNGFSLSEISFIFCSDRFILKMNKDFLSHNFLTDVITFDLSEIKSVINGEVYISVNRVKENSDKYGVSFQSELHRVMIHGVLHLLGYDDKTPAKVQKMRKMEDMCLSLLK